MFYLVVYLQNDTKLYVDIFWRIMRPLLTEIRQFMGDPKKIAEKYSVSMKTAIRWLKYYGLFKPDKSYNPGKLGMDNAREIRKLHKNGVSMKNLAVQYDVTFSTISRVVHNIIYQEQHDSAQVSMIYNVKN